jgi:hypothetical protein
MKWHMFFYVVPHAYYYTYNMFPVCNKPHACMFCREEIQRIKAAKPDIPHREAFSMAAKNVRHIVFTSSFYLINSQTIPSS